MAKKLQVDLAARNVALIEHRTACSAVHPPLPSGWCRALESFGVDVSKSPNQMCRGVANPVDHVSVAQHGEVDSRYALVCWTLLLASFRASSTASSRMYAVTARPAARARCDNRSTSRAIPWALEAGSCRQNSTSLVMTPTHATGIQLLKFTPNELTSQTPPARGSDIASCHFTRGR
jgi:hypothetical protein